MALASTGLEEERGRDVLRRAVKYMHTIVYGKEARGGGRVKKRNESEPTGTGRERGREEGKKARWSAGVSAGVSRKRNEEWSVGLMKGCTAWYQQRISSHVRIDARDRSSLFRGYVPRREGEAECVGKSPPPLRVLLGFLSLSLSLSLVFYLISEASIERWTACRGGCRAGLINFPVGGFIFFKFGVN